MPRKATAAVPVAAPEPQAKPKDKRPIRSTRQFVETEELEVGQDKPRTLKAAGPAESALEPANVQPIEHPVSRSKLEALKFNEEILTIMVHDSTNPVDDPLPEVWNDGTRQAFIRGREQQVKRKYVEVLARAKRTVFAQEELPNRGGYRNIPHTALRYPFQVIHDPNPRGRDWLKAILAEG